MISSQLLIGSVLIVANAVFHVIALVWLAQCLYSISGLRCFQPNQKWHTILFAISVLGVIAIHTVSAWGWAAVYLSVGEFDLLTDALYFSVVTVTTLGYGDITLSEEWRMLASFEAMGGLVMFGASTAFLLGVVRNLFQHLDSGGR